MWKCNYFVEYKSSQVWQASIRNFAHPEITVPWYTCPWSHLFFCTQKSGHFTNKDTLEVYWINYLTNANVDVSKPKEGIKYRHKTWETKQIYCIYGACVMVIHCLFNIIDVFVSQFPLLYIYTDVYNV